MFNKKKSRKVEEVNSSTMADIAFLLLVFFLVVTKIDQDKGIYVNLPEWSDLPPPEAQVIDKNMFLVLANDRGQILVEEQLEQIEDLKRHAKEFIDNNGRNPLLSESPQKAIISFAYDRSTKYDVYIQVYNELKAAYNEIREDYCQREFDLSYAEINKDKESRKKYEDELDNVRAAYPINISEAKPKDFGNN